MEEKQQKESNSELVNLADKKIRQHESCGQTYVLFPEYLGFFGMAIISEPTQLPNTENNKQINSESSRKCNII